MIRLSFAALALVSSFGAAHAAELTPTDIVNRHMAAAARQDVDAIMADYADDAVNLTAGKAVQGKPAIRAVFAGMFKGSGAGTSGMKVTKVWEEGDVGFVTWTMGPVTGTEEFLVRNGKILVQTVFISAPPAG
ncbi:MAG: nuclear transport factor 2 family protein [Sphingomonadales bacterium]|nr:nuclear transport factor 2 family protein [Sphingomonadales bacterium]